MSTRIPLPLSTSVVPIFRTDLHDVADLAAVATTALPAVPTVAVAQPGTFISFIDVSGDPILVSYQLIDHGGNGDLDATESLAGIGQPNDGVAPSDYDPSTNCKVWALISRVGLANFGEITLPESAALHVTSTLYLNGSNVLMIGSGSISSTGGYPVLNNGGGIGNTNTTLGNSREIFLTAALTAPRTWTLPPANSFPPGCRLHIVDKVGGISGTNTLTLQRAGTNTIGAGTTVLLNSAYACAVLISDGVSRWTRMS